ncbi:MAG: phosphoenolpyruvate mutase, partial [Gammaproteobacteria bacterium]|nr:phosphoenolpyruvate mutase [Gammaproteobacteria bacterium]
KAESIDVQGIKLLVNRAHDSTGELASLACAREAFADDMVIVYGDVLFRSYILRDLVESDAAVMIVVDSNEATAGISGDFAYCSEPDDRSTWGKAVRLEHIAPQAREAGRAADGRWIGMVRFRGEGRVWLTEALDALSARADFTRLSLLDLLNHLVTAGKPVHVWYVHGHWLDVNSVQDLADAGDFAAGSH